MGKIAWRSRTQIGQEALENEKASLRSARDRELRDTDFRLLSDAPGDKQAWARYRQELRDLPAKVENASAPEEVRAVAWPQRPDDA